MSKTHQYKVEPTQFINVQTPQIAYLLGLLWADGYVKVIYRKSQRTPAYKIETTMVSEDLDTLIPLFNSVGKWCIYHRTRKKRKPQTTILTNNQPLVEYLQQNDYGVKSIESACKILSKIPTELHKYWFRGVSDGDGCFYVNEKNRQCQFSITSEYEQKWNYFESLLNKLNIKYGIQRLIRKKKNKKKPTKHSSLRITSKIGVVGFGNYIYNGYTEDGIGLKRKYDKYIKAKELFQTSRLYQEP